MRPIFAIVLTAAIAIAGCAAHHGAEAFEDTPATQASPLQPPATQSKPFQPPQFSQSFSASTGISLGDVPTAIEMTLYKITVPYGTVSRNEKFWKRIDESVVDITTYETLFKNGIRVGEAPTSEWDDFRKLLAGNPAVTQINSLVSVDGKTADLPVRKEISSQDIFYFDSANELHGRSFDACENIMTAVLRPAPRKKNTVRLTLCPVVRSKQKRLEYNPTGGKEGEFVYSAPEHLYDLNLRVDVPVDSFFIVAPSGEATWPTSVGNRFLVNNAAAERTETVLLMVPRIVNVQIGWPVGQEPRMNTDSHR
jgi:hypothetical protein